MHGAHPGHLAFKLLDLLSLSSCFSRSPSPALSLVAPSIFPLCTCLNVYSAAENAFLFLSSHKCPTVSISVYFTKYCSFLLYNFPTASLNFTFLCVAPYCIFLLFIPLYGTVIRACAFHFHTFERVTTTRGVG